LSRFRTEVREFLLLEQAQRQSSNFTRSQRTAIRAYYDAAMRQRSAARDLRGPDQTHAALSLYRAAGLCLTFAYLISRDESIDAVTLTPDSAFERLDRALESEHLKAPSDFTSARALLVTSDPLAVDSLTNEQAGRLADKIETSVRWLSTIVDPRSPRQLKLTRAARLAAAPIGAGVIVAWLTLRILSPPNVARDKPVRGSSTDWSTTAAGAVDGEKNGRFGFHTHEEDQPWLIIDLERSHPIGSVKVFGRGDCCFDQSIPLALEVSDDGVSFRMIGERTEPFSESEPWVFTPTPVVARFIRLRTERHSVLVVSEVEVYEKSEK
jgi:hypothetical protein